MYKNFIKFSFVILFSVFALIACKKDGTSSKMSPLITWDDPVDISYGTLLSATQLNATANVTGSFVYTPEIGTKLDEGNNQVLRVDFTPTDKITYNVVSKTVKINVIASSKIDPVITWANPADISYGTLLSATQLNATVNASGSFVYTPAIGTKLNEGANQDLKVDFTPNNTTVYNTVSKTVKINVISFTKTNPAITWANPADIAYRTLLSAKQLNATANVLGSFVYTPAIGTKLNEGANQDLKVVFTPSDTNSYNVISKTVKINVTATPTTVTDIDGNIYKTVIIGDQVWLGENLKTTKYSDGTSIPLVADNTDWSNLTTPGYCWYKNDKATYGNSYGALYNWYVVNTANNGGKNICPVGWHVSTVSDWTTLVDYLGGADLAGGKLKETGTSYWNAPNTAATNSSGFAARGAGYRYVSGSFMNIKTDAAYWTNSNWIFSLKYDQGIANSGSSTIQNGFSVRCVMD